MSAGLTMLIYIVWRARSREYIRGESVAKTGVSIDLTAERREAQRGGKCVFARKTCRVV